MAKEISNSAAVSEAVRGYYTLSNYGIRLAELPGYQAVPAALLGRLAVARECQGAGLEEHLLMNALERTLRLADEIAIQAIVVDAIDPAAADFYERYEFRRLPSEPLRLFMLLATVARLFA